MIVRIIKRMRMGNNPVSKNVSMIAEHASALKTQKQQQKHRCYYTGGIFGHFRRIDLLLQSANLIKICETVATGLDKRFQMY